MDGLYMHISYRDISLTEGVDSDTCELYIDEANDDAENRDDMELVIPIEEAKLMRDWLTKFIKGEE